jgi:hypothetical protein
VKQNRALPDWCGILDGLISEDNKDGVGFVLEAKPTPPTRSENQHRTREAITK